jgi:pSer/pThr/pTyr-binding forkhead associated (FHA) protein
MAFLSAGSLWEKLDLNLKLDLVVMSGVEDGLLRKFTTQGGDGKSSDDFWTLTIGRHDKNDLSLRNDTFISRHHANLHWKDKRWWLEDLSSTNGTFIENPNDFFDDTRVKGIIPIDPGQLFRVGRTWLRLQDVE